MSFSANRALHLCWWALLAWQLLWHAVLPAPAGSGNWLLAAFAMLPLAALTPLVLRGHQRGHLYGGMAVLVYFIVGVMEAWSNPPQRLAALVQVGLSAAWVVLLFVLSRLPARD